MAADTRTPLEQEAEPLTGQLAFRSTDADKAALRLIAVWNEESESEVLRRYFDFDAFRAEAAQVRAVREQSKESTAA